MTQGITGATRVAGVVGRPVRHSLSPLIHNAWLAAAEIDAVYAPFSPAADRLEAFVDAHRGGDILGFNITLPFKAAALACADTADEAARKAGAANLLLFREGGAVEARNTDGLGLLAAFAEQAPRRQLTGSVTAIVGAGGAARGAAAALTAIGARVWVFNRTLHHAQSLANAVNGVEAFPLAALPDSLADIDVLINASAAALNEAAAQDWPLDRMISDAAVMDMVYTPLHTPLLRQAQARGLAVVDGLAMLIGQARPSFQALLDQSPPDIDVRSLVLSALERRP